MAALLVATHAFKLLTSKKAKQTVFCLALPELMFLDSPVQAAHVIMVCGQKVLIASRAPEAYQLNSSTPTKPTQHASMCVKIAIKGNLDL